METTVLQELNKSHYRNLRDFIKQVNTKLAELAVTEDLKEANEILEQKFKAPYGFILRPIEQGYNGALRYLDYRSYDGHTYTIELANSETGWKATPSGNQIDGERFSQNWLNLQLENDIEGIRQKQWFEAFSLEPLEVLIYHLLGINVKLEKSIYKRAGNWIMSFSSTENLVQYAGICKAIMEELRVDSFGSCSFYYDKDTGEQCLSMPNVSFSYRHTHGGTNGYEIARVHYNMYSGNWYYLKDGVAYTFYDANRNEYKNMPATV